ncbi:MAG: CDP-diacylglycerol--glycerol-3-phosphate 3-phosphatidyltransferase [Deltaproteobacteria bacterium]|nr:CDP-diacylglycerol--glycerol-3-phosphate 3-phosphatidyltransferase [Deltaproteobacteria bacterium]
MNSVLHRLPNWLTYLRLGLIPVFVVLMIEPTQGAVLLATFVFIIAAITDYTDGYIARRYGAVSDSGKLLDPMADKILVLSALVMLVAQRSDLTGDPWVPGWMVVLVLAREIWVTGLRGIAASKGVVVAATQSGKYKSGFQMVAIVFLLLHDTTFPFGGQRISCQSIGVNLLFFSIVISYWGAVEYSFSVLGEEKKSPAAKSDLPQS